MRGHILKFTIGFFVGAFLTYGTIYLFGAVLNELGINLYNSESEQQRNFNIFIAVWLIVSLSSGYLVAKRWK